MLKDYEQNVVQPPAANRTVHDPTNENRIRLILLDDHGLFRASLARLLACEGGFEVVCECSSSGEAMEILSKSPVDVILLDFDLGPEHANHFICASRKAGYQGQFLIFVGTTDAEISATALKLGASGIFLKSEAPERLVQAIKHVATGGVWVDQKIIQLVVDRCLDHPPPLADGKSGSTLGDREQQVLSGILSGLKNRDIAEGMGISESSVKNTLQGLFCKTGVRTRSQLVRMAVEGSLGNVPLWVEKYGKVPRNEVQEPDSAKPHNTSSPPGQSFG